MSNRQNRKKAHELPKSARPKANDRRPATTPATPQRAASAAAQGDTSAIYLVHALTPIHVGADQGIGAIDQPTLREAHTGWPVLPGSSFKGVLREQAERHWKCLNHPDVLAVFGPPTDKAGDFRGGVVFGDAFPLFLPVRSLAGTFAWVTCPLAVSRLSRDLNETSGSITSVSEPASTAAKITTESALTLGAGAISLEGFVLRSAQDGATDILADVIAGWLFANPEDQRFFKARVAVVHNDIFAHLCRYALEVRARVAIDDATGTVANGPWTVESMPAEIILCGLLRGRGTTLRTRKAATPDDAGRDVSAEQLEAQSTQIGAADAFGALATVINACGVLRFGGGASVGLGRARVTLAGGR